MGRSPRQILIVVILLTICDATPARADSLESLRSRGTLVWGADQEGGGPFVYPAEDDANRLIGFEVELAELIATHIGIKAQFQQGQWDKLPDLLDRGDIDSVLNGFEWNPNRAERYGTSIPYYIYELQLLARVDDDSLQSWADLLKQPAGRNRKVSLLGGAAAEDYAVAFAGDRVDLALFDGVTDAMRGTELGTDGIDANVQDLPIWLFYRKDFPKLRAVGPPVGRGFYVALVRKEDRELLSAINDAMLAGFRDGRMWLLLPGGQALNLGRDSQAKTVEANEAGGVTLIIPALHAFHRRDLVIVK